MNKNKKIKNDQVVEKVTDAMVAEPEILIRPPAPPCLQPMEAGVRAVPNLDHIFFEPTRSTPDGPFLSPIVSTARMLKTFGMDDNDLKAGLTVCLALNSGRLCFPLSTVVICKEPSYADEFLNRCMQVTPGTSFMEFSRMHPEMMFHGSKDIRGKTVVSSDPEGFKMVCKDVDRLLSRGYTIAQELNRSKFGVGLQCHRADMPLSLVGTAIDRMNSILQHPSLMWVSLQDRKRVTAIPSCVSGQSNDSLFDIEAARLKKAFERLSGRPVHVPFAEVIMAALKDMDVLTAGDVENLFKTLCMVTIINNPPPVQWDELVAQTYGVDRDKIKGWLSARKDIQIPVADTDNRSITATKIDYYYAWLLLNKVLPVGEFVLTPRQGKVFDVLKRLNLAGISNAHINDKSAVQVLSTIAHNTSAWITREKVYENINKEGGEYMSLSTVNNELQYLLSTGIVDRKKPPKTNQFKYHILTLEAGQYLTLPHPSEIMDPIYEGEPVDVVNPLTGAVEKI